MSNENPRAPMNNEVNGLTVKPPRNPRTSKCTCGATEAGMDDWHFDTCHTKYPGVFPPDTEGKAT